MSFSKVEICGELKDLYKDNISLYKNDDYWKINVIIFQSNIKELKAKWQHVSSAVSMCYQADVGNENEFEKWNLYIIFSCFAEVGKEVKARIENDKFSSRKIVEENQIEELSDEIANNLIIQHITNTDLVEVVNNTQENIENIYIPKNKNIWELIPQDISILGKKEIQDNIIENLKKISYEN